MLMKKNILFALTSVLFLGSCISTKYISVDVYQPAKVTLSPEIVNIAIVDNSPTFVDNSKNSLNSNNIEHISVDTAKCVFIDSLVSNLNQEKFFGNVIAYPYSRDCELNNDNLLLLSPSKIKEIAREVDVDAIVTLDNFFISGKLYNVSDPFINVVANEMALGMIIKLSIYSADGTELSEPILLNDTLYWSELFSDYPYFQSLPSFKEATQQISTMAAETLVKEFVPYWETQTRYYFADSKTDKLVQSYKWEEAQKIWKAKFNEEKKAAKKACLAHNIALSYECLGNLDEAIIWIDKTNELLPSTKAEIIKTQVSLYDTILKNRSTDIEKLKDQIGSAGFSESNDL